jgi:hypothetical protein
MARVTAFHGARAGRVGAGVADQAEGAGGDGGQAVFDERLEAFFDDDFGQHRVARLFQAQDQVFANRFGLRNGVCQKLFSTL